MPTRFWMILLAILALAACDDTNKPTEERTHSAYYWSTTFENDSALQQFITQQKVSRIYLRFFDVVVRPDTMVMPVVVRIMLAASGICFMAAFISGFSAGRLQARSRTG